MGALSAFSAIRLWSCPNFNGWFYRYWRANSTLSSFSETASGVQWVGRYTIPSWWPEQVGNWLLCLYSNCVEGLFWPADTASHTRSVAGGERCKKKQWTARRPHLLSNRRWCIACRNCFGQRWFSARFSLIRCNDIQYRWAVLVSPLSGNQKSIVINVQVEQKKRVRSSKKREFDWWFGSIVSCIHLAWFGLVKRSDRVDPGNKNCQLPFS